MTTPMDVSDYGTSSPDIVTDWSTRAASSNDSTLRKAFLNVLAESADLPPEQKLIMYDACDEGEVRATLGPFTRKRLDARRNTKPNKPNDQHLVCTPFDESKFHFGKIRNPRERMLKLRLGSGRYDILTNKFPLFPKHMLLVCDALVPQQMTGAHLGAIAELLQSTSGFCAYFNSWCASASVNHFHCHVIDEFPPVTSLPLVPGPVVGGVRCLQPKGFSGFCYVFPHSALVHVDMAVRAMQADNQPHNLLVTPHHVYVWPKPLERPARSFELYPETVGGPELLGSFTVYTDDTYEQLNRSACDELLRINTAPLPSRLLAAASAVRSVDDAALFTSATAERALPFKAVAASRTTERLPQLSIHTESWPQDRPIARALASNIGLC